jgi:two-component system phosphate regulon sensor histidine kinase PhoR
MSIRIRLILNYIGIALIILLAMYGYLNHTLKRMLNEQITSELKAQAHLVRDFLLSTLPDTFSYEAVDALVDGLNIASDARLTFIGPTGIVWGDTERDGKNLERMDNHRNRPEILEALSDGIGIADRYSITVQTTLRYFALPMFRQDKVIGVCRVALPMKKVDLIIGRVKQTLLLASGAGLVVAIFLSLTTAGTIMKPIRNLTRATKSLADGKITSRVPVPSSGELDELSRHFNQMADRIQAQLYEISQEHRRSETILEKMVEGVILIDSQRSIVYANPAAVTMLALSEDYHQHPLIEAIRDPALGRLLEQAKKTSEAAFDEIRLTGEIERETEIIVVPVANEYLVVIHDVSQLRKLEQIRADFVANVSHELRTPLTSIQGYAETLLNGTLSNTEMSQRFVAKILQQSSQLSQLISDLLDLSRIESGAIELKLAPCKMTEFQEPIISLFGPAFDEFNMRFEWQIPDDLPTPLVDKLLIEQVFVNLIDNALKYTPQGGSITVSGETNESEVIIYVSDTGIGITSDALPRIFERFYRVDKGRSREMGGTGLGLSITKHILLQHGGRIWAESVFGKGSVFKFALPLP